MKDSFCHISSRAASGFFAIHRRKACIDISSRENAALHEHAADAV
jgi:hypothetical protein